MQVSSNLCRIGLAQQVMVVCVQWGVIKAFLRLFAAGAPDAGNSLPAVHFPLKTT